MKGAESYEDIIHLSRPKSRRAKMTPANRAAQFAPFAALTGYEASIRETGRLTQPRVELTEGEKAELNRRLCFLLAHLHEQPEITVTYFLPDARKEGGSYPRYTGRLKKIDPYRGCVCFADGKTIPTEEIIGINSSFFIDTY